MNKKRVVLIIAILVSLIGFRSLWVFLGFSTKGGGHSAESPNGLYTASAMSFQKVRFWGNSKRFYWFWVDRDNDKKTVKSIRLERLDGTPQFTMRDNRIISWSSDSSVVTFAFQDMELQLEVGNDQKPKDEPKQ